MFADNICADATEQCKSSQFTSQSVYSHCLQLVNVLIIIS